MTTPALAAQAPVLLGTTEHFSVLAYSTITNTGATTISGSAGADIGLFPGTSITGKSLITLTNGVYHQTDAVAQQAKDDLVTAYNDAAGRLPVSRIATQLGGQILSPGVYDSASGTFDITGTLTLDAGGDPDGVFIFLTQSTLITASSSVVSLINNARYCRVFWQVGSSATLGTDSTFIGHILAMISITANTSATIQGQLLARTGAVTLDTNTITNGFCVPSGTMTWVDNGNAYLTRPTVLVLMLTKTVNGKSSTMTATPTWVKTGNTWTYTYANLPLYEGGYLVTYSVAETVPTGYTKTSTDLSPNRNFTNTLSVLTTPVPGFTLAPGTTLVPGTTFIPGTTLVPWPTPIPVGVATPVPSATNLPPTGDKTTDRSTLGILAAGTGIVLVLAGISLYLFKRRKAKS